MSVVSVSTVFISNSATLGLNDRVASFMDHLFAIGIGLSVRYFIDFVSGHDLKLVGCLVGLWEGIVMLHFMKRNRRSRKLYDPYIACGVRFLVDYAFTQDISRIALTIVWSCLGGVLAELVPPVLKELGLGRFWKNLERDLDHLARSMPSIPLLRGPQTSRFPSSSSRAPSHVTEVRNMSMASYPTTITPVSSYGTSFTRSQPPTNVRKRHVPGALPGYTSTDTNVTTPQANASRSHHRHTEQSSSSGLSSLSSPSYIGTAHATSHFTFSTLHTGTRTRTRDTNTADVSFALDDENKSSSSSAGSTSTRTATIDPIIPDVELEVPITQSPHDSSLTPTKRIPTGLPTPSATASARNSRHEQLDPDLRQSMATEEPPSLADMRTIRTMPSGKTLREHEHSPNASARGSVMPPSAHNSNSEEAPPLMVPPAIQATPTKKPSKSGDKPPTPTSVEKKNSGISGIPRLRQPQPPQRDSQASSVDSVPSAIPVPSLSRAQPPPVQITRLSQVQQQNTSVENVISPAPLPIPPADGRSHLRRTSLGGGPTAPNAETVTYDNDSGQPQPQPAKTRSVVIEPTTSAKGKEKEAADNAPSIVSMPALSNAQRTMGGSGGSGTQKQFDNATTDTNKGVSKSPSKTDAPSISQSQAQTKAKVQPGTQPQPEAKVSPPVKEPSPPKPPPTMEVEKTPVEEKEDSPTTPATITNREASTLVATAAARPGGVAGATPKVPSASNTRVQTPVVGQSQGPAPAVVATTTLEMMAEQNQQLRSSVASLLAPPKPSEQPKQSQPQPEQPQQQEPPPPQVQQPAPAQQQPKKKTSFWGRVLGGGEDEDGGNGNGGTDAGTAGPTTATPTKPPPAAPADSAAPSAIPRPRKASSPQLGADKAGSNRTSGARQSRPEDNMSSALGLVGIEPPRSQSTVITQAELDAEEAAITAGTDAKGKGRARTHSQVTAQPERKSLISDLFPGRLLGAAAQAGSPADEGLSSDGAFSTGRDSLTTEPDVTQSRLIKALDLTRKVAELNRQISELNEKRGKAMALGKVGLVDARSAQEEIRKAEKKKERLNGRIEGVFKDVNVLDEPIVQVDLSAGGADPSLRPVEDALEKLLYPGTGVDVLTVLLSKKTGTSNKQRAKLVELLTDLQVQHSYNTFKRMVTITVPNTAP